MRFRLHLLVAPVLVGLVACGGGGDSVSTPTSPTQPTTPTQPTQPAGPVLTSNVTLGNNFFNPANIQVSPGTTVTWSWPSGSDIHNVTFQDGTHSPDQGPGTTFTRTFNTAGTFNYQCTLHGGMSGSVLVK